MICPKCKGKTFKTQKIGPHTISQYFNCKHCDNSREIKEGDVWKCELLKKGLKSHMFYCNPGWKYNPSSTYVVSENEVRPIERIKEVT
jgi:hypothetical protein